ncbi:hypothetical protein M3Y97_00158000 [Aphelenchoides bicaudatus]|nr:hypothetical protein M3Y97_00158000 [Aphelenchoides bicaudatus]
MDESEGFLLTNLAFNTQYDVELQPLSTLPSNSNVPIDTSNKGASSSAKFQTIACADVFGGGSLQCEPESVRDFDIRINEENSTVLLTWRPSSEPRHVLLYELRYVPVSGEQKCALDESTMYLPAKATSAEILIPGDSQCEVEVYLTNFDLRGREASLTARFVYKRKGSDDEDNSTFYGFDSLSTNIWIIISAPLLVIVALLVILRFAAVGQRKLKKKIGGLTARDETTQKLESKIKCSVGPPPVDV